MNSLASIKKFADDASALAGALLAKLSYDYLSS